uniref:Centrosomal protein 192 n=1 Tax=Anabas testudineus TaxID=64144 RepID=A0A7N6AN67_ANATE
MPWKALSLGPLVSDCANATHSVVYQNEEGQWVTDLAYYSPFQKEIDEKISENAGQLQTEDFVPASDALEKIVKDQEEFEKEHQFISNSTFQSDSSWKAPPNSHILMRASQVASEFKQEDQSYLRLSLGQFFGQRSEALGCLGSTDDLDGVKRNPADGATLSDHNEGTSSRSGLGNQSCISPGNNSSHLMLSISTIASAIADASISTDPSQLAAMIMELSKRIIVVCSTQILSEPDRSSMLDTLQRSGCVGELSAFDMEKYLKKTDMSDSDASVSHTTFDLTSWADNLSSNPSAGHPKEQDSSSQQVESDTHQMPTSTQTVEKDRREDITSNTSSSTAPLSNALSLGHRDGSKRSSVPLKPLSSTRRPMGSVQSSRFKSPADKMAVCEKAASSGTKTCGSSARIATVNAVKPGQLNPQSSSNIMSSLEVQRDDTISPASPNVPSTSPSQRKVSSPLALKLSNTGQQQQQDIPSYSTGKKPSPRNNMTASLPYSSVERNDFSCQNTQPPRNSACVVHFSLSFLGQVVVPEELRFPHACCVGIASQTSLSLFNPSERWQQVSVTITSMAIDGEKVESFPYQCLIVKNKTIIGPKTSEEQKVLFIPPQPGVYQCVLSVCSWPASAETEVASRANIFVKKVVLVAIAENPALEIEVGKSGCLDFGDLSGGSAKSLPLKLLNRTCATVPIRLVISANATAWRCFSFSKHPITMTSEVTQQAGHMTPVSPSSVMNHVMHASYGEIPESLMVWVHFKAPQKYTGYSVELGPADEYIARVDIEVDSPGPSHVIRSIPIRARSGTARVHAPKDMQTVSLSAPLGKSSQQTLPLKNAGNIDVQLKLKCSDPEDGFSVTPNDLFLNVGEEQEIVISFKAQHNRKCRERYIKIFKYIFSPQYEVTLKGEVVPEDSGKAAIPSAAHFGPGLANDVPPILSNKQFVAWGGVTLGRAIQQKLVLRNNSTSATQQLRLLIRGQDQDCFQLQSMFSPEERLTRHGELSIRPREDVTVHLLFAPTRVACMLAKLEIKQSGARPSQPGVKFTIPLSGYGGTSNIILEEQRKQTDGYVATLTDIAVGHVSKVCLCVRNTGSRAAFIKAIAFSDLQKRSVLESSVISLAPSQFVLKERTQESLCASGSALLTTVCLFCGDEVSRQQYRRFGVCECETNDLIFLTAYDLPLRPNEAHIFYGNMSKVVVSLMGSMKNADCEEKDHPELLLPSARCVSEADSGLTNGNVSLDVLPVKGPQGTALMTDPAHFVLCSVVDGTATTSQIQIRNNTSRELSFDLSWPAHCLTITPQHGVIECHLQILISPNPSLATKYSLLPWSGQIYVQCDSQQKFIKVQIRQDLALDVSAAPADKSLSALPPQAATPVLPVVRPTTRLSEPLQTPHTPQAIVEISNKTIVFPTTPSGETSERSVELKSHVLTTRETSADSVLFMPSFHVFSLSQVPITFLPRDRGDYAQFWDLECHPVSDPQQKTRIRFQLCGTGAKSGPVEGPQEGDCSLAKAEATVKTTRRAEASGGKNGQEEGVRRGVYSPQDLYTFPVTRVGESSTLKVNIRNNSTETHELNFVNPREPFHIKHSKYTLRSQHYLKLPVHFKPSTAGRHTGLLLIQSETSGSLVIQLTGEASP